MKKSQIFMLMAIIMSVFLMVIAFIGCGTANETSGDEGQKASVESEKASDEKTADNSKDNKGFKIAFSNSYVGNSWRSESVKIFDSYAKQLQEAGEISEYYSSSSGNDPQAQINEIRNLMSKGYDAILVNAASPTALAPVLEEAVERGIVIVAFDNTVDSDKIYNVNTDQVEFGRIDARWLMDEMGGQGNILMISGIEGTTVSRDRVQGFNEILDKYPDVNVLQMGYGKWDDAATSVVINNMLAAQKSKGIDGILSEGGGENAVFEALKQHNIDPSTVPMTGEMTNGFFRHMVEDGVKGIAVGQPPYLSAASLDVAISALKGENPDKLTLIPVPNATYEAAEDYYVPSQPDNFFVDWTDKDNTYNLQLEDILPNK